MFSSPFERAAIIGAVRSETSLEVSTRALLDGMRANENAIGLVSPALRVARIGQALQCIKRPGRDADDQRKWLEQSIAARMVACIAGGIKKDRGMQGLEGLDARERAGVNIALASLIIELQAIQKLMYGGRLPRAE